MDQLFSAFSFMNTTVVLWIAVSVAVIFVLAVAYDALVRRRKSNRKRRNHHGSRPGFFQRMRKFQELARQEIRRRRRHKQRGLEREAAIRPRIRDTAK